MSTTTSEVQAQIQAVARPLYERLLLLDEEVEQRETELAELKKARTQLRNVVKGIAPELLPEQEKPKKKSSDWQPKADRVAAMHEFLLDHREELNGDGFHAAGLTAQYPKELPIAYSTVHRCSACCMSRV